MSDPELSEAVAAAAGVVVIGFKNPESSEGVNDEGVVGTSAASAAEAKSFTRSLGAEVLYEFKRIPAVVARISPETVTQLRSSPYIDYLEPNAGGTWASQITPWNVTKVGAPTAWSLSTGSSYKVLILDSGTPLGGHRDLSFPVAFRCVSGPTEDSVQVGHGTAVAGVIGATNNSDDVIGVAYGANMWMANIADGGGSPSGAEAACSVDLARINGVFVVNMSFSVTEHTSLTDGINGGYNSDGMLFVAAAGNTNGGAVTYPASLANVIAVTAVDSTNAAANFAAIGSAVELSAPGVSVLTTEMSGSYVNYISGTSFAAPHVAAAAVLLKSRYTGWSNTTIRSRLQATATDLGSSGLGKPTVMAFSMSTRPCGFKWPLVGQHSSTRGIHKRGPRTWPGGRHPFHISGTWMEAPQELALRSPTHRADRRKVFGSN